MIENALSKIRADLEAEVHNKLALHINPELNGAITWVACVMCWYKLQRNVITKFNAQVAKFELQKETWRANFTSIVAGKTSVTTKKGAEQLFSDVYTTLTNNYIAAKR